MGVQKRASPFADVVASPTILREETLEFDFVVAGHSAHPRSNHLIRPRFMHCGGATYVVPAVPVLVSEEAAGRTRPACVRADEHLSVFHPPISNFDHLPSRTCRDNLTESKAKMRFFNHHLTDFSAELQLLCKDRNKDTSTRSMNVVPDSEWSNVSRKQRGMFKR